MTETFVTDCMAAARVSARRRFASHRNRDDLIDRAESLAGELATKASENATIGSIVWRAIHRVATERNYQESIRSVSHPLHRTEQRSSKRLRRKRLTGRTPLKERLEENPAFIFQVTEDFRQFLATLTKRRRLIASLYLNGYTTGEIAKRLGVSDSAVSQTRTLLLELWREFTGDVE